MRFIVFSDSHRNFHALHQIIQTHPQADLYLHLGDGAEEAEDLSACFPELAMRFVRGNNDWASDAPTSHLELCGGKRIWMTHGHLYGVKGGLTQLLIQARHQSADIVLYGHTHIAYTDVDHGLHIMNPGSVSLPMGGPPTYGIIDLTDTDIQMRIVPLNGGGSR